jgi:hypothetical protein
MRVKHKRKQRWQTIKLPLLLIAGILIAGCLLYAIGISRIQSWINPPSMENVPAVLAQAPCVADVCIGMRGRDVVVEKLSQSDLLHSVDDDGSMPISFSIHKGGYGMVRFAEGGWKTVSGFELYIEDVTLKTVLDIFGEPDEMFLMFGACGRGFHIHARLFYPDQGIEVRIQYPATRQERRERGAQIVLDDHSPVQSVHYFDPSEYDERLLGTRESLRRSGYFYVPPTVSDTTIMNAIRPWPGLGVPMEAFDLCPSLE